MECFYESRQPGVHSATTAFHLYGSQLTGVIYNEVNLFVTFIFYSNLDVELLNSPEYSKWNNHKISEFHFFTAPAFVVEVKNTMHSFFCIFTFGVLRQCGVARGNGESVAVYLKHATPGHEHGATRHRQCAASARCWSVIISNYCCPIKVD